MTHSIGKINFEIDFNNERKAVELQKRFVELLNNHLIDIIEEELNEVISDNAVLIESFDLELNDIYFGYFEQQIPEQFRSALRLAISEKIRLNKYREAIPDDFDNFESGDKQIERLLMYYFRNGVLPWWSKSVMAEDETIEALLMRFIGTSKNEIIEFITSIADSFAAKKRFVAALSEAGLKELSEKKSPQQSDKINFLYNSLSGILKKSLSHADFINAKKRLDQIILFEPELLSQSLPNGKSDFVISVDLLLHLFDNENQLIVFLDEFSASEKRIQLFQRSSSGEVTENLEELKRILSHDLARNILEQLSGSKYESEDLAKRTAVINIDNEQTKSKTENNDINGIKKKRPKEQEERIYGRAFFNENSNVKRLLNLFERIISIEEGIFSDDEFEQIKSTLLSGHHAGESFRHYLSLMLADETLKQILFDVFAENDAFFELLLTLWIPETPVRQKDSGEKQQTEFIKDIISITDDFSEFFNIEGQGRGLLMAYLTNNETKGFDVDAFIDFFVEYTYAKKPPKENPSNEFVKFSSNYLSGFFSMLSFIQEGKSIPDSLKQELAFVIDIIKPNIDYDFEIIAKTFISELIKSTDGQNIGMVESGFIKKISDMNLTTDTANWFVKISDSIIEILNLYFEKEKDIDQTKFSVKKKILKAVYTSKKKVFQTNNLYDVIKTIQYNDILLDEIDFKGNEFLAKQSYNFLQKQTDEAVVLIRSLIKKDESILLLLIDKLSVKELTNVLMYAIQQKPTDWKLKIIDSLISLKNNELVVKLHAIFFDFVVKDKPVFERFCLRLFSKNPEIIKGFTENVFSERKEIPKTEKEKSSLESSRVGEGAILSTLQSVQAILFEASLSNMPDSEKFAFVVLSSVGAYDEIGWQNIDFDTNFNEILIKLSEDKTTKIQIQKSISKTIIKLSNDNLLFYFQSLPVEKFKANIELLFESVSKADTLPAIYRVLKIVVERKLPELKAGIVLNCLVDIKSEKNFENIVAGLLSTNEGHEIKFTGKLLSVSNPKQKTIIYQKILSAQIHLPGFIKLLAKASSKEHRKEFLKYLGHESVKSRIDGFFNVFSSQRNIRILQLFIETLGIDEVKSFVKFAGKSRVFKSVADLFKSTGTVAGVVKLSPVLAKIYFENAFDKTTYLNELPALFSENDIKTVFELYFDDADRKTKILNSLFGFVFQSGLINPFSLAGKQFKSEFIYRFLYENRKKLFDVRNLILFFEQYVKKKHPKQYLNALAGLFTDDGLSKFGLPYDMIKSILAQPDKAKYSEARKTVYTYNEPLKDGIYIKNAGLVIIIQYLKPFFEHLGLTENADFKDETSLQKAIFLLQYLCEKNTETPEYDLAFNKIICGATIDYPVENQIEISENEMKASDELLMAVIKHWTVLKSTGIDSLRVMFLMREGRLCETEKSWELKVERKDFDILVERIPWTIQMQKTPWMEKLLVVDWV